MAENYDFGALVSPLDFVVSVNSANGMARKIDVYLDRQVSLSMVWHTGLPPPQPQSAWKNVLDLGRRSVPQRNAW